MAKKPIVIIINKFVKALTAKGIRVDKVILYGSHARGTARPDSDIDVAVVSRDFGRDRTEEGMMLFRVAGDVDARIEPFPLSLRAYKEDTWVPLIYEIRTKGVELKAA